MTNNHDSTSAQSVLQPVTLPSGRVISNGLVKAAMYEHMASLFGGLPNAQHFALYNLWSRGGWGMIITGNVQVSADHLTLGRDMIIPESITPGTLRSYQALTLVMRTGPKPKDRPLIIMQLSHAGRQSPLVLGGRSPLVPPLAPSALGLGRSTPGGWFSRLTYRIGFPTPRAMTLQDIDHIVNRFVLAAKLAHDANFDGVELHGSHGYLLAQFISPKSNVRDDAYSAVHAPLHLLQRIVTAIRGVLPRPFVLGVKLSSSDYVGAGSVQDLQAEEEAEDRAVTHIVDVASWDMVDFIEISGGDYENPGFLVTGRQAFYSRFARKARSAIHSLTSLPQNRRPLLLLTGGMRSPTTFQEALAQGHADLVGVGRGSVLAPDLPLRLSELHSRGRTGTPDPVGDSEGNSHRGFPLREPSLSYADTPLTRLAASVLRFLGVLPLPGLIGAGAATAWYAVAMKRISSGRTINYQMGLIHAVLMLWLPELQALALLFSCFCIACFASVYLYSLFRG